MFRILLLVVVILIGYDAIAHQGIYTRNVWSSIVGLTDSAVSGAKQLGQETREETAPLRP